MLLVVISLLCQRLGASIAGLMFGRVDSSGMVALRLVFSACLLLALGRPSRAALRRLGTRGWVAVVGLGLTMAGMNLLICQAFDPIPQGVAVTFEVLGPLALSVLARRRWDAVACALLALVGIGVLGREGFSADAGLEMQVLRRMSTSLFSLITCLSPVVASLTAWAVRGQVLDFADLGGRLLVIAACAAAVWRMHHSATPRPPESEAPQRCATAATKASTSSTDAVPRGERTGPCS